MKTRKGSSPVDAFRLKRRELSLTLFDSRDLFAAGLLAMPAFLFNTSLALRIAQFLLFWLYAWSVGRKNSILMTFVMSAGIVGCNLLVPYGSVLAEIGAFRFTKGALLGGIEKAVTVEGLIMLSKATVRSDLRLPGSFGAIIGESFRYFERIMERKGGMDWKDPIGAVDRLMVELSAPAPDSVSAARPEDESAEGESAGKPRRPIIGRVLLGGSVLVVWIFLLIALV